MAATNVVSKRGRNQFQGMFSEMWTVSCTLNVPNCANGDATGDAVTVPGVALGDIVIGKSLGVDQAGLTADAYVSAANTVKFIVNNGTGDAVDLASTTFKFVVVRPLF